MSEELAHMITGALPREANVTYWGISHLLGHDHVWLVDGLTPIFYRDAIKRIPEGFIRSEIEKRVAEFEEVKAALNK